MDISCVKLADFNLKDMSIVPKIFSYLAILSMTLSAQAEPLKIVTSIRPLALMVEGIVGDDVQVRSLLGAGASPHHYALRMNDRIAVEQAHLFIWIGEDFERFLVRVVEQADAKVVLTVAEFDKLKWPEQKQIVHREEEEHHHEHGAQDLHIWLDPRNTLVIMEVLARHLIALRPALKQEIQGRLNTISHSIESAYRNAYRELQTFESRLLMSRHDGYGHLFNAFDLVDGEALVQVPDENLGARHFARMMTQAESAACVLVDISEPPSRRQKLRALVKRPVVTIDLLGSDINIKSYRDLLSSWVNSLKLCLSAK